MACLFSLASSQIRCPSSRGLTFYYLRDPQGSLPISSVGKFPRWGVICGMSSRTCRQLTRDRGWGKRSPFTRHILFFGFFLFFTVFLLSFFCFFCLMSWLTEKPWSETNAGWYCVALIGEDLYVGEILRDLYRLLVRTAAGCSFLAWAVPDGVMHDYRVLWILD